MSSLTLGIFGLNSFDPSGAFVCEGADPGGICKLQGWRRVQQKNMNMNPSCGLSTLITKVTFLSALDISCAVSVVVVALDSPEREKREGSTTPCGVKDVVGPGSRTQARLAAEKQNVHFNGQQRFSPVACPALR